MKDQDEVGPCAVLFTQDVERAIFVQDIEQVQRLALVVSR